MLGIGRPNVSDRMLKFIKPQSKVVSLERLQKQKELFGYTESCYHGFPAKPSALAWDSKLHLLAIAAKSGHIRVYGSPGVEFTGVHENTDAAVIRLCFLPGEGSLVSLCEDNSLHLWKISVEDGRGKLVKAKSTCLEGKLKKISAIIQDLDCKNLLIGTEGGNIYLLNLVSFTISNDIIYQDVIMQNVPENYKLNPGPVEVIAPHPYESHKILIGYQRGLIVLWDMEQPCAEMTYVSTQQLEDLCWNDRATEFISSHNDGSYIVWSIADSDECKEGPETVYGPFPCKPISKIRWFSKESTPMKVFGGGMPRASFGDRNTVTVIQGEEHVTFNVTSRIIDYEVTTDDETGCVSTLIILAEEEIIFIDLASEGWLTYHNPYLSSLHSSAITCSHFVDNVDSEIFEKIKNIGAQQRTDVSSKPFPINGGSPDDKASKQKDILLTGHEDGTIRFWDASNSCLSLLYKLATSSLFVSEDFGDGANGEDEDWPPFRKVGLYDPYSDDPRLGVKKIEMCPYRGILIVAGTSGQIIVLELNGKESEIFTPCVEVNLVADNDSFTWKSHTKLDMKKEAVIYAAGMQPVAVLQFYPPASCTSLNLHSEWGLLAAGTAHGFVLFDFVVKKNLLAKSTLTPVDVANACDEGPMSRRKSLKKSLRESFRRLRRGRSQKKPKPTPVAPVINNAKISTASTGEENAKPMERAVEERSKAPDYIGSMVRSLHLTKCYLASNQLMSATLWAGTNSGSIYVFTIAIPPSEKRSEIPLTVQLGKEIHLKHGAPVVNIAILDGSGKPYPSSMAVKKGVAKAPDTTGHHRVLISSEEQFKVFSLPQLKHYCKYKLTAHEGSRVRKLGFSRFVSSSDPNYSETCFMAVSNLGDFGVYSLPDSRKQAQAQCIKKEDISGINSVVFSSRGESLFLVSAGELLRVSLSANQGTFSRGTVKLDGKEPVFSIPAKPSSSEPSAKFGTNFAVSSPKDRKESDSIKENGDTSVLSGDVTIDSIRDHMDELKFLEKVPETVPEVPTESDASATLESNVSTTTKEEMETIVKEGSSFTSSKVVTVSKTTVISSQESSSVQVVETSPTEETKPDPADEKGAPNGVDVSK